MNKKPTSPTTQLESAQGVACCSRCHRAGILICQYVIPNRSNESTRSYRFEPWVFRSHLCRYHLGAENRPNHWRNPSGKKKVRLEWKPDSELIADWERSEKPKGLLTENSGWQIQHKRIIIHQPA